MDWVQLTSAKSIAGSLANWANNSQITPGAGGVADFIVGESTQWISSKLRHWRMLTSPIGGTMTAVTVPSPLGQDTIPIPVDLIEMNDFFLLGLNFFRLDMKPEKEVIQNWSFDGNGNRVPQQPVMYYVNQSNICFDAPPDKAYTYAFTYYQQIPGLNAVNSTNFITTFYPLLMRAVCMVSICEWTKELGHGDYTRTYWEEKALSLLEEAQMESDRSARATIAGPIHLGGGGPGYPIYGW